MLAAFAPIASHPPREKSNTKADAKDKYVFSYINSFRVVLLFKKYKQQLIRFYHILNVESINTNVT